MTAPAPEGSDGVLLRDGAPEQSGALRIAAGGGNGGEEADTEDAARAVADSLRDRERVSRELLRPLDPVCLQLQASELREHSALPPRYVHLPGHSGTLLDQRCGIFELARVACDRPEHAGGLHEPEDPLDRHLVAVVQAVALVDQRASSFYVAFPERDRPEAMEQHRPAVVVSEALEGGKALLPQPRRRVGVAGDRVAAAEASEAVGDERGRRLAG